VIGEALDLPAGDDPKVSDVRAQLDRLDPIARRVFDGLLVRRFARPDEIAVRSGVDARQVIRALPVLELAGLAEAGDGGYRVAREARRAADPDRASSPAGG
jgi:hypothetical protein